VNFARAAWIASALLVALVFGYPLWFLLSTSLQPEGHGLEGAALAQATHFENYARALRQMGDFPRLFLNTLLLTVLSIAGQLCTCSLAGYALARVRFRGRELCFALVLAGMCFPDSVGAIARFLLFRALGLVDTYAPLVLPTVLGGAPLFIFLFRQYYRSLPEELTEAARVDGCSHLAIWRKVMLPLSRPMLVTVGLFTFLATWNDFWAPLVYLLSPERRTLSLALAGFQRTYDTSVECLMAASAVVFAPCLIVYFLGQRLFLRSVRVAASKG
jgi:multiple sugar transport system permease protein